MLMMMIIMDRKQNDTVFMCLDKFIFPYVVGVVCLYIIYMTNFCINNICDRED